MKRLFVKAKTFAILEQKIKEKDEEILRLKEMLGLKNDRCLCKSEFCIICEHFMGVIDGTFMCRKFDKPPCVEFQFNGYPLPNLSNGFVNTELTDEYLLSLPKKRNN